MLQEVALLNRPSRAVVVIVLSLSIAAPEVIVPSPAHAGYAGGEYSAVIGYTLGAYAVLLAAVALHRHHRKKEAAERSRVAPDSTRTVPDRPDGFLRVDPTTNPALYGVDVERVRPQPDGRLRLEPVIQVRDHGAAVGISLGF